jgi:lysozyme
MKSSHAGLELIKKWEGFRAVPYLCSAHVWTIGFGHTHGVTKHTPSVTKIEANALLALDVRRTEASVQRLTSATLNQNQFDALVSFVFNLGGGAYQRSTLRARINRGEYEAAAGEFMKWVYAAGKKQRGLIARRAEEMTLFETGAEVEVIK